MKLDHRALAAGVQLISRARVGSTSSEALALARSGERGPVWIFAREQTAGRGRRGRSWHSPPGNFYASLLLSDPCAPERAPQLSFVAALALFDALSKLQPELGRKLHVKWPNDLLLAGAKVAGVLVEGESLADRRLVTVIGMGVNCAAHPSDTPYPATNFRSAGYDVNPETLMLSLSHAMAARLQSWAAGAGFDQIREHWMRRAPSLGQPMRVRAADAEVSGAFSGIDADGRLILTLSDGTRRTFHAAELMPAAEPADAWRASAAL